MKYDKVFRDLKSPGVYIVVRSTRLRWARHVARMEDVVRELCDSEMKFAQGRVR